MWGSSSLRVPNGASLIPVVTIVPVVTMAANVTVATGPGVRDVLAADEQDRILIRGIQGAACDFARCPPADWRGGESLPTLA
jgi:hypothetical protein